MLVHFSVIISHFRPHKVHYSDKYIFWIVYFAPRYLSVVVGRKSRLRVYKKNDGLIGLDRAVEAYYKMNNT